MDHKKLWLIGIGAVVLLGLFLGKKNNAATASTASTASQGPSVVEVPVPQIVQVPTPVYIPSGSTPTPTVPVIPISVPSPVPTANHVTIPTVAKGTYAPIRVVNFNAAQVQQTAYQNPGSPVTSTMTTQNGTTTTTYGITKADAQGNLHYANNYNQAVNAAGGQWLNHIDFKGQYTPSGQFVTSNPAQQAAYNKLVPVNASK